MKFFGVKMLISSETKKNGKKIILVEERIVLLQARNHDSAINKARRECEKYANETYLNMYGKNVKSTLLDCFDSFELLESPRSTIAEVYSMTEVMEKPMSKSDLLDKYFGERLDQKKENRLRSYFLRREFNEMKLEEPDS